MWEQIKVNKNMLSGTTVRKTPAHLKGYLSWNLLHFQLKIKTLKNVILMK